MANKNTPLGRGEHPGPTVLTEAEQREKLEGYTSAPRDCWPFIKYATHVRYTRKSGEFRTGGFVLKNAFEAKVGGDVTKRCIQLQNGFYKQAAEYRVWDVPYDDIEHLYIKGSAFELMLQNEATDAFTKTNLNIQKIVSRYKVMDQRMAALEQRLLALECRIP